MHVWGRTGDLPCTSQDFVDRDQGQIFLLGAMGVLARKWKALARSKNRYKKKLPWITLQGSKDSAMGIKDLKPNVPLIQTALEYAPDILNKPRKIEKEVSRLPLAQFPLALDGCTRVTSRTSIEPLCNPR